MALTEQERAKLLYLKGYRYRLEMEGEDAPDQHLYVKTASEVGPLMRHHYPKCTVLAVEINAEGKSGSAIRQI